MDGDEGDGSGWGDPEMAGSMKRSGDEVIVSVFGVFEEEEKEKECVEFSFGFGFGIWMV